MKTQTPAYRIEAICPRYLPTILTYDYKRHGKPTDAVAAEILEAYAPQLGEVDTLKIIRNTGPDAGEVVASATGIITIRTSGSH